MKADVECLTCILRQAVTAARLTDAMPNLQFQAIREVIRYLYSIDDLSNSPAELSTPAYRIVKEITGHPDPYKNLKEESTRHTRNHLKEIEKIIQESSRHLWTAGHLAVIGNTIDFGIFHANDINIERDLMTMLKQPLEIDDFFRFRQLLPQKKELLYICDNAGEIYFDYLFSREISLQYPELDITFIVRSFPVINDATMKEAQDAGLNTIGTILCTGNDEIGLPLSKINPDIQEIWKRNPLVISKGQGNFETLNQQKGDIFFLLKAKCPLVAHELGVKLYDAVFKYQH